MSLEELLKEPKENTRWKKQRKKLLRFLAGLGVAGAGLTAGAFMISHFKSTPPRATETPADKEQLAELMRLRDDTQKLSRNVQNKIRSPAAVASGRQYSAGTGRR